MERTISSLVVSAEGGDRSATAALFDALYSELHRLARKQLVRNAPDMTIGTTTLLHEAYLDTAQREGTVFPDQGRFMAYAARVMKRAACLIAGIAAAAAWGCTPHRSKQEKLEVHFAVGTNWPTAIQSLEQVVGPAQLLGGKCATDLGTISFTKLQTGEYLLEYPTRGAGAPGHAMPRSPEAFASALGDAFAESRCTHAELQYDQYAVAVDVDSGAGITSARVSRAP